MIKKLFITFVLSFFVTTNLFSAGSGGDGGSSSIKTDYDKAVSFINSAKKYEKKEKKKKLLKISKKHKNY